MKYFIDTAEQNEIHKWEKYVDGATSNPSLLAKVDSNNYKFCRENEVLFKNVFIQVNSLEDVQFLFKKGISKKQVIFKVPLVITEKFDGYKLLKQLNENRCRTCATIVYDIGQFDYACEVGAEFSIVLYAKNNNKFIVEDCCDLKQRKGYKTKVIAASFRTAEHVHECIEFGADYATVPPKIMEEVFTNKNSIEDYNKFYGIE